MKNNKIKKALFASAFIVSASCFLYVNTIASPSLSNLTKDTVEKTNQIKDARTPDVKLVTHIAELISRFITAK